MLLLKLFTCAILLLIVSCEALLQEFHLSVQSNVQDEINYRLPDDVQPFNYKLDLTLEEGFETSKKFTGKVAITLKATKNDVKSFKLHARDLDFDKKSITLIVKNDSSNNLFKTYSGPEEKTDFLTINTNTALNLTKIYILTIPYTGKLSDTDMSGFYLSTYKDSNKDTKKYLATTQFEDTGARRAFPCFDEPALKATFDISITVPAEYTAMSNTPTSTTQSPFIFEQTPIMSTYLVAFIVSELKCKNGNTVENVPTNVCSRPGTEKTATLALTVPTQIVPIMESYTKQTAIEKVKKLSQVAIPDMAPGAMENWGLITFREAYLLYDETESSLYDKQKTVTSSTHEISHQWFGDLVTLDWWSDTFLNEGFATYFEYFAPNEVEDYKNWELTKQFVIEQLQTALVADSKNTALPLSSYINNPDDMSRFDDISYNKGGSILRMVHHFLTLETFKTGLIRYFYNANLIGTPLNLWNSLNEVLSDEDKKLLPNVSVNEIMDNWTKKIGYPVVNVTVSDKDVKITQTPFISGEDNTQWYIPLTYTFSNSNETTSNDTNTKDWLKPNCTVILHSFLKDHSWVVLNNQQVGYYRVDYDEKLWTEILNSLNSNIDSIDEMSRSQIVDDLLNFAKANKKNYGDVFEKLKFLENDSSYYSWYSAFANFNYLLPKLDDGLRKDVDEYLTTLMKTLVASVQEKTERKTDDHIYTLKQVLAQTWACNLDMENCTKTAVQLFNNYKNDTNKNTFDSNLRSVVYCTGLRKSVNVTEDFNFLWEEYISTDLANKKVTILKVLGCAHDSTVRKKYLEYVFTDDIRRQDAKHVFSSVYSAGNEGVDDILDFITDKYQNFTDHFGSTSTLSSLLSTLADYINTDDQVKKLNIFIEKVSVTDYQTSANSTIQIVKNNNLKVKNRLQEELKKYFNNDDDDNNACVDLNNSKVANIALVLVGYVVFNLF